MGNSPEKSFLYTADLCKCIQGHCTANQIIAFREIKNDRASLKEFLSVGQTNLFQKHLCNAKSFSLGSPQIDSVTVSLFAF